MGADLVSRIQQLLNVNLPETEPTVFDATVARKLRDRIDNIRLHAHTYSLIHNLTHGSLKPIGALEFAYEHELCGLNIHVDDGGEHSLTHSTPSQLAQSKYKDPSETPFDEADANMILLNERRWARNQVNFIRSLLTELRWLATLYLEN